MYEKHWGLNEKPFENTPDPQFMFHSSQHEEAYLRMMYAIREGKGAALLTGEYGSGKTLLSRVIINELIEDTVHYEVALVTYPQLTPIQFMQEMIYQLDSSAVSDENTVVLLRHLQESLYRNFKGGKRTVIMVDEAQVIKDAETLEELRLLLNFQLNDSFLATLILIGQPELIKTVNNIPQLEQRISVKYHLHALDRNESEKYIRHRLDVAGAKGAIFTEEAVSLVYDYSQGIPRRINNACDIALLVGYTQAAKEIDKKIVEYVLKDLTKG
jgi:general secretion pathway protein A